MSEEKTTHVDPFAALLAEAKFEPSAVYIPEGDCIEFIAMERAFRGERVDDILTVLVDEETNQVVGAVVKGIRALLRQFPGLLSIEVHDGRMRLECLLRVSAYKRAEKETRLRYERVIKMAGEAKAELGVRDLCPA